jgi:hypothetical protein
MNFKVKILAIKSLSEIPGYWTDDDYIALLDEFDYHDAKSATHEELPELLEMAITDFEPRDAARILLTHKLSDQLTRGQIDNLSHDMIDDDETKEYPDIGMHYPLFSINQMLHDAYHGIFRNSKATQLDFELTPLDEEPVEVNNEIVLKALQNGISDKCLIIRLFDEQIEGKVPFGDAEKIIWELHDLGNNAYSLITSDNWLNREDLVDNEFESTVLIFEEKHA